VTLPPLGPGPRAPRHARTHILPFHHTAWSRECNSKSKLPAVPASARAGVTPDNQSRPGGETTRTRLIAITSGGIEFGSTCAAWNLYYGPDQVSTALLGAVDCVRSPGVQDFDIVIAAVNLVSGQVQGPLHAARVRFICTLVGDLNCDAYVDFGDINPFVLALTNPAGYEATYPNCYIKNGDINRDTRGDFGDINAFVRLLTNP